MDQPAESRLAFEAVKIAMSQTKDGVKLTLVLHPHDDPHHMAELFQEPVGSRYMLALVRIGDDEQPVNKGAVASPQVLKDAGALCRDPDFHLWLYNNGKVLSPMEDEAVDYIHRLTGVQSRAELVTNQQAQRNFYDIRERFLAFRPITDGA